jgi:TrpR-related protein YerC/YecD
MSGKIKYNSLSEKEKKEILGDFYTMVSLLSGRDEVKSFFKDLLSLSEITMISRRLQIAKLLLSGLTYNKIRDKLGVGFATIAQVDKWLNEGFGGYKKIIKKYEKMSKKDLNSIVNDEYPDISLKSLRKKHPGHFLLLNLLDK